MSDWVIEKLMRETEAKIVSLTAERDEARAETKRSRETFLKALKERPVAPHPVDQMGNLYREMHKDAEKECWELRATIAALIAERDEARKELREASDHYEGLMHDADKVEIDLRSQLDEARQERGRLREAAKIGQAWTKEYLLSCKLESDPPKNEIKQVREALAKIRTALASSPGAARAVLSHAIHSKGRRE